MTLGHSHASMATTLALHGFAGRRLRARRGGDGRLALDPSTTSLRLFAQDDTLMAQNDARARLQSGGGFPPFK